MAASSSQAPAERQRSRSRPRPGADRVLNFGRHEGETFENVFRSDAGYCRWASTMNSPTGGLKQFARWLRRRQAPRDAPPPEQDSDSESGAGENPGIHPRVQAIADRLAARGHAQIISQQLQGIMNAPLGQGMAQQLQQIYQQQQMGGQAQRLDALRQMMRARLRAPRGRRVNTQDSEDSSGDGDVRESEDEEPSQNPAGQARVADIIIARSPQIAYSAALFSGDPHPEACPICMEDFAPAEGSPSQPILLTPCLHAYHDHCLKGWLNRNHFCPSCRWDLRDTGEAGILSKGGPPLALVTVPADMIGTTMVVSDDE